MKKRRRFPLWLWIVGGIVVLALVVPRNQLEEMAGPEEPQQSTATSAPPPQTAPTPQADTSPATTADTMPYLPGLTQADVTLNLKQFTWGDWQHTTGTVGDKCGGYDDRDTGGQAEVCLYGGPSRVGRIVARVINSADTAGWLLPYVATVPFEGSDGAAAKAWVTQNLPASRSGTTLEKDIGGATYQIYGDPNKSVYLEVKHPGYSAWAGRQP